jgi:sugar lactone lactonase YvrE
VRAFEPVVEGLVFTECPRWHDGGVWYSDTHVGEVHRFDPASGVDEIAARHSSSVSGLGFLPDGRLLAVSSMARTLLRLEPDGFVEHADMSTVVGPWPCNDMAVDAQGRAYVGGFGYDIFGGAPMVSTHLVLVTPDGAVRAVGDAVTFPNGTIIAPRGVTADGATLIVAETMSERLVAFTITDDGSLVDRRVYAHVDGMVPDGICLDAEGAVWVAHPRAGAVRVLPGGEVTERIELPGRNIYACVLGGDDRRTLYACTGTTHDRAEAGRIRSAKLEALTVDVPGAGVP